MTKKKAGAGAGKGASQEPSARPRLRTAPLKSTVLLGGEIGPELLAFTTSIGSPMAGGGDRNLVCTASETNMRISNQLVDEPMVVREIWYDIPRVAAARFQQLLPCSRQKDYVVTTEDRRRIVSTTLLRFYIGGDRPVLGARLDFAEPRKAAVDDVLDRGAFVLPEPVTISRVMKFWVALSWTNAWPVFGRLCEDSERTARIPVAIYLVS